jgi:hypothetical protein
MTREEQGRDPQDVERPLASTRWSESGAAPDDELLPPFMPGRSRQPPAEHAPETVDSRPEPEPSTEPDWGETDTEVVQPVSEGFVTDHQDAVADTGEAVMGQDEAVTAEEDFPFETPGAWDEPYSFDADSQDADADESAGEPWGQAMFEPWRAEEAAAERWDAESAAEDRWAAGDPGVSDEGRDGGFEGGAVAELAQRLEDLAARIRAEGAKGARAGMTSSDRLTALLSTLIAGYLEGREG